MPYPSHSHVVVLFVSVPWLLERKRSIISTQVASKSNQHLPQRRMDIKEEGPVNVVTSHLPKVGFIPTDVRWLGQAVEAGGEAEEGDEAQRGPPARRRTRRERGGGRRSLQPAGSPLPERARPGPAAPRRRHGRGSAARQQAGRRASREAECGARREP